MILRSMDTFRELIGGNQVDIDVKHVEAAPKLDSINHRGIKYKLIAPSIDALFKLQVRFVFAKAVLSVDVRSF